MLYAFDLIEHDGDDLRIGEPDDACDRTPEGISRRFSLPVRLGDRVRVSFVALIHSNNPQLRSRANMSATVYFPTIGIRHLRIAAIIGRSEVEHLRYLPERIGSRDFYSHSLP